MHLGTASGISVSPSAQPALRGLPGVGETVNNSVNYSAMCPLRDASVVCPSWPSGTHTLFLVESVDSVMTT